MTTLIWYAAYGSNLSRARFDIYLRGGCPDGASYTYPGCRDVTAPSEVVPAEIAAELKFGGASLTWGGGVAFVESGKDVALARLYLLTLEQFCDVVAQENWLDPGAIALGEVPSDLFVLDGNHTYRAVVPLPDYDGVPVLTVSQPASTQVTAPSAAYLRHVAQGLREAHGLSIEEVVGYLSCKAGVSGLLTLGEIAAALE